MSPGAQKMKTGPDALCFHVLRSRTCFGRYRGRRLQFSCFVLSDSFWAVPRVSGFSLMFCAPGLALDCTEGVGSHFHVLLSLTHFRCYRQRRIQLLCFALSILFSTILWTLGPVSMFCTPRLVSGGTLGVRPRFQVLLSWTHFRR
jgi:hypothetical protein